jgi:hypothetical protein
VSERRSEADDDVLVAAALADATAFAAFYRTHVDAVCHYCHRRLGTREAAEDATSLVVARALDALANVGQARHTFDVNALNVHVELQPGAMTTISINAPAGAYDFARSVPGHKEAGMVGRLFVDPSYRLSTVRVVPTESVIGNAVAEGTATP